MEEAVGPNDWLTLASDLFMGVFKQKSGTLPSGWNNFRGTIHVSELPNGTAVKPHSCFHNFFSYLPLPLPTTPYPTFFTFVLLNTFLNETLEQESLSQVLFLSDPA